MNTAELIALAREEGLDAYELDVSTLIFRQDVREMCASDKCRNYNRSWSCPPACGTPDEMMAKVRGFSLGILLQTVGHQEDEFDYDAIMEAGNKHAKNFRKLVARLSCCDILPLGMGTCSLCPECSYPDAPCRFPEQMYPSMEAAGLMVSDVCSKNGVPYYHGRLTIAYTSCILFN